VQNGQVRRLLPDGPRAVAGAAGAGRPPLTGIAVSYDDAVVAGIGPDGGLWSGPMQTGGQLRPVLLQGEPAAPEFTRDGSLWTVEGGRSVRRVTDITSTPVVSRVPVEGLPPRTTLVAAVPARDGARVALVVRSSGRTGLLLTRVVRSGEDVRLSAPVRVESRLTDVTDVAWAGADRLAVLGSDGAGAPQVFDVDVARGILRAQGAPVDPESVAAAPDLPVLVAARDGGVYQASSGLWRQRVRGESPAYPG
jgi:Lipoprotein LpqB beta-propeller domain